MESGLHMCVECMLRGKLGTLRFAEQENGKIARVSALVLLLPQARDNTHFQHILTSGLSTSSSTLLLEMQGATARGEQHLTQQCNYQYHAARLIDC